MAAARLYVHLLGLSRLLQSDHPAAGLDRARVQPWLAYLVLHCASPIAWQQFAFLAWPDSVDQTLDNLKESNTHESG
jgi:DNA-binding SARP family transcriptional activator